jgi:hypothetical protein
VSAPLLDLTATPDAEAERATQLLHGEGFVVYEEADGLAWGQSLTDGYVGWVAAAGLGPPPKRRPDAALSPRSPPTSTRPPTSSAAPSRLCPSLARLDLDATTRPRRLRRPARRRLRLPAPTSPRRTRRRHAQAERFLGTPYLWGGRSAAGLDCSALVQLALAATGVTAPRDSDMQAALLGKLCGAGRRASARGDLVFWRGHVGLVADDGLLVHANAHHMAVVREPLAEAEARIAEAGGGPVTGRRRLAPGAMPGRHPSAQPEVGKASPAMPGPQATARPSAQRPAFCCRMSASEGDPQ